MRKKGARKPEISAPKQISGPTSTKAPGGKELTPPRPKLAQSETSDIVKRRYSTRYNQLPDFSSGAPAVPSLAGHLKRSSHGGSPSRPARPSAAHAHALQVDINALADPNLQPERCRTDPILPRILFDISMQMWPTCSPMPRNRTYRTTRTACAESKIELLQTCNKMFTRIERSSLKSARKPRSSNPRLIFCVD